MKQYEKKFKVLLGYTKPERYGNREPIFLEGFSWDCGWYWGGGCVCNQRMCTHFDSCFLDTVNLRGHSLGRFVSPWCDHAKTDRSSVISQGCSVWEPISFFLNDSPEIIKENWWRIKDLYKQFYRLRAAAEVFRNGGHCTSIGRSESEIVPEMDRRINNHIGEVIIPEICKALGVS